MRVMLSALTLTVALLVAPAARAGEAGKPVPFILDFVVYGKHAPHYVSLDQGFFREEGLAVEILRGQGSGEAVKNVALGKAEFGHADTGTLILARTKGQKARVVGMIHHKNLLGVFFLKKTGIRTPKDLEGKVFGGPLASAAWTMFPAFARAAGINPNVEYKAMDAAARIPSFVAGRIQATTDFMTSLPGYLKGAEQRGEEVGYFLYADYGLDFYNNGFIAHDDTVARNPDLVRRFARASYRGIAWSVENPERAVDVFMRHVPQADRGTARLQFKIMVDHLYDGLSEKQGLGVVDEAKMRRTIQEVNEAFKIREKIEPKDVYTNDFVKDLPKAWLFPKRVKF
ncbi:MAG: ABC transporter substrate-binding protein [Deltaproteobacteria bacterium]|nr:ABC transporter substrate-binding protein [Deltaproteobacteria bacterium]